MNKTLADGKEGSVEKEYKKITDFFMSLLQIWTHCYCQPLKGEGEQ